MIHVIIFLHRYESGVDGSNGNISCLPSTGSRLGRNYAYM